MKKSKNVKIGKALYAKIVDICVARYAADRNCKDCQYYGRLCEHIKHADQVKRPSDRFYY